jgi:hypothetical protein
MTTPRLMIDAALGGAEFALDEAQARRRHSAAAGRKRCCACSTRRGNGALGLLETKRGMSVRVKTSSARARKRISISLRAREAARDGFTGKSHRTRRAAHAPCAD